MTKEERVEPCERYVALAGTTEYNSIIIYDMIERRMICKVEVKDFKMICDALNSRISPDPQRIREEVVKAALKKFPTNWCDSRLSGPDGIKIPAGCPDVERLMDAIKDDIRSLLTTKPESEGK